MKNKELIRSRFARALPQYETQAAAQRQIAYTLLAWAQDLRIAPQKALEIGCGSGVYSRLLQARFRQTDWDVNDLCAECAAYVGGRFLCGDIESIRLPESYDFITSASALQWLQRPAAALRRLSGSLNSGGVLLFNTFTPDNLAEIRALTGAGLVYPGAADWQNWLAASGLELLRTAQETLVLEFAAPRDVLRHLQQTGVTATAQTVWSKTRLRQFETDYAARFAAPSGGVRLTYTPLYFAAGSRR